MKLAHVVCTFQDLVENVQRNRDDVYTCEDERATYLESLGLVWLTDAPEKPRRKRKTKE